MNKICKIPSECINYDTPWTRHTFNTAYLNNINETMRHES